MYHGLFLILERAGFETFLAKLWRPFRHLYAMLAVMVGWVFFRSDSLEKAFAVLKAMAGMAPGDPIMTPIDFYLTHSVLTAIVIGCLASAPIGKAFQALLPKKGAFAASKHYAMTDGWCMANSLVFLMLFCLSAISIASGTYNPFIYFRF